MAEAHQPLAAIEHRAHVAVRVARALDVVEHPQHTRGRAPWSGPESAPAADSAAATSAPVEATTRAVNVEAFMPCSAAAIQ